MQPRSYLKTFTLTLVLLAVTGLGGQLSVGQESLDGQVQAFEKKYSVDVIKKGFKFETEKDKISGADSEKADDYLREFLEEFNLYPPEFVKRSGVKKIVICKDLAYDGQLRAAVPGLGSGILYYDAERSGNYSTYQRAVVHHEYFHLVDWQDDHKIYVDDQWAALNPPEFKYGRGGVHVQGDRTQGLTYNKLGFMNKYSTQGVEEDKAEIFSYLITEPKLMSKRIKSDSVVAAKVKMMKQLMSAFSPSMDDAFWAKVSKVKRVGRRPNLKEHAAALAKRNKANREKQTSESSLVNQWHTHTLSFEGPETSESAKPNPFTDYRLLVTFKHADAKYTVRGFYAADGNAAESGAEAGNVWQVRFSPDRIGEWTYSAELRKGNQIAIDSKTKSGKLIEIENATGSFEVTANEVKDPSSMDFRQRGRLTVDQGYFRFGKSGPFWLKGGADSPENLLAFADFDGTFRTSDKAREGENDPGENLHRFPTHVADWSPGDPTWRDGKGKGLIGAMNYLSSTGMNAVYFLTMNIEGDGKDVWPFASPNDFTRFDCSKLDQWEIVFDHMQSKGLLLHIVTQETENERLLDDGETGPQRKLYLSELIARFAHHPAIVWNLGEENGPAEFSPNGQTTEQQKAMASYLKQADPYQHPVVIHTHAAAKHKEHLLPGLIGHQPLDGLSFQVDQPKRVHKELIHWKNEAAKSGHDWLIAMDEIGKWDTGVVPDSVDADHDSTRHEVLWGTLMAGGAGVEWYFGANQPHNDLTSEDWRQRENMWLQTKVALDFFQQHLPYWEMKPADDLTSSKDDYCFAKPGTVYAIYSAKQNEGVAKPIELDLGSTESKFEVHWFDPKNGGELQAGSVKQIVGNNGKSTVSLGNPPHERPQDWVVLVKVK